MSSRSCGVGPAEAVMCSSRHQRVAQRVVLVVVFDDRARQAGALRDAQALARLPAATLRTTTSSGMISTSRISCSRMFSRRTKWVGMPISASRSIRYSLMRLFSTPLPVMMPFFCALNGGGVVLEILHEGAGLRTLEQDLGFSLIELSAAGHGDSLAGVSRGRGRSGGGGGIAADPPRPNDRGVRGLAQPGDEAAARPAGWWQSGRRAARRGPRRRVASNVSLTRTWSNSVQWRSRRVPGPCGGRSPPDRPAARDQPGLQRRQRGGQQENAHHVARQGGAEAAITLPVDVEQDVAASGQRGLHRRPRGAVTVALEHQRPFQQAARVASAFELRPSRNDNPRRRARLGAAGAWWH